MVHNAERLPVIGISEIRIQTLQNFLATLHSQKPQNILALIKMSVSTNRYKLAMTCADHG